MVPTPTEQSAVLSRMALLLTLGPLAVLGLETRALPDPFVENPSRSSGDQAVLQKNQKEHGLYVLGDLGDENCPQGYEQIVDESTCAAAATALNLNYLGEIGVTSFHPYCLHDTSNRGAFNLGGSSPNLAPSRGLVCKRTQSLYVLGDLGDENCPQGYEQIRDESTCGAAASALGFGSYLGAVSFSQVHPYCLYDSRDDRGGFNLDGKSSNVAPVLALVCKRTPVPTSYGDPHVRNINGESFDVRMPGRHTYLAIPRGAGARNASLLVIAKIEAMGPVCKGVLFVTELNFTGKWLGQVNSLHISTKLDAEMDAKALKIKLGSDPRELNPSEIGEAAPTSLAQVTEFHPKKPQGVNQHETIVLLTLKLGPSIAKVRMVYQKEKTNWSNSLWITTTGLRAAEGEIGGILGLDDHSLATQIPERCKGQAMLLDERSSSRVHAQAALADEIADSEQS